MKKTKENFLNKCCYYSDPRKRFWRILFETGLTSKKLKPCEYMKLFDYSIGLTDVIKDNRDNSLDAFFITERI